MMGLMTAIFAPDAQPTGITPRPEQADYAAAVSQLFSNKGHVGLFNAETGIGKTLGYLVPATDRCDDGDGIVIATHTLQLVQQILNTEMPRINAWRREQGLRTLSVGVYYGVANYLSVPRAEALLAENPDAEAAAYLRSLVEWGRQSDEPRLLLEYIEDHGQPPSDINPASVAVQHRDPEAKLISEGRVTVADVDVLVTTHATMILDSMTDVLKKDETEKPMYLIVDEADQLPETYQNMMFGSINLVEILHDLRRHGLPNQFDMALQGLIGDMRATGSTLGMPEMTFEPERVALFSEYRQELTEIIRQASRHSSELADYISRLDGSISNQVAGAGFTPVRQQPRFVNFLPYASRYCGSYLQTHYQSALLTSATLSVDIDMARGTRWLEQALKLEGMNIKRRRFAPKAFGDMALTLGAGLPRPLLADGDAAKRLNPQWLKSVAEHVAQIEGSHVLVMTSSFAETRQLSTLLREASASVIEHRQGERLGNIVPDLVRRGGILITPAGGVGFSVRAEDGAQLIQDFVITRIPFSNPDTEIHQALRAYYAAFGQRFLQSYAQVINQAVRDMKQRVGRAIRDHGDRARVHILDPRFPRIDDMRAGANARLKTVIPERFTEQYRHADFLGVEAAATEEDIW